VADILLSLDRKIELNRKTNKTLEEMGQALFKHYFIQNPDAKNWPLVNFGSVVDVVGGGTPSTKESKFWDGDIPWTSPRDLTGHDEVYLLKTDKTISELGLKKISSGLLPEGTLLMSSRAPIGYVAISATEIAINQGYIAFRSGGTFSNNFMFFWLKQNMNLIKNAANGSTFMEISKTVFRSIEIRKPSEQVLINFEKQSEILFENIKNLQYQSQNLLELRDLFLPRLMSGKISL
jgi:type I restriction enzyme S subunit